MVIVFAAIISSLVLLFGAALGMDPAFVEDTIGTLPADMQFELSAWVSIFMLASVLIGLASSWSTFGLSNTHPSLLTARDQVRLVLRILFYASALTLGLLVVLESPALNHVSGPALLWLCSMTIIAGAYRGLQTVARVP